MQMMQRSSLRAAGRRPASVSRGAVRVRAASADQLWYPGAARPAYLDGSMAGDRGFDPMALGANPTALKWYQQSELQHARWAMLGVAGILVQEVLKPSVFWYEAGQPQNLPAPFTGINMGGLLAFEFIMMHWVEVRRWQDFQNHGSVNEDPIFKGNKVPNLEMGYPGGIFDPLGFSKGNLAELKTKEIKNGRLAMIAFAGFTLQAQATGKGPLGSLAAHLSNPFGSNWASNIGHCNIPSSVNVEGLTIPLTCLWPGQH